MLRLPLLVFLTVHSCTAYVTEPPSFAERLDRLYEKLERFTLAPPVSKPIEDKLNAKLDKLNALKPDPIADDDEELVSTMQLWGDMSEEQLRDVIKELQLMKDEEKSERLVDGEYGDGDYNDEDTFLQDLGDGDYAMDGSEDWDPIDDPDTSTSKPGAVVPSAITRTDSGYREVVVSAVDPVAATYERPRILDDSNLTPVERVALRRAALANMGTVVRAGKCLTPQARWLPVRQLAPAADTVYMPPCVQLHRCAPDSGCCYSEAEVCAPVDGKYVAIPFYLNKVDGNFTVARMLFFNHTRCACVSRETLQSTARAKVETHSTEIQESTREKQVDWRQPTEEPRLERDEEQTAPPQLRRCTCPVLFTARISNGACTCICDWAEPGRRRDCQSLARGREHFGLRDRVCVSRGDCAPPACEHGRYDPAAGRCPRRYRRLRYHRARYHPDKTVIV
ncbi:unnamed protein product [Parnassius mnemosyne]|uniref:Platelet-derived growth factor (PDGF) family profile domain-containing protein n=1 Tax=Parnassius mnemosyne TaxID=213953 RepID=A0AAV1M2N1_9NEOP